MSHKISVNATINATLKKVWDFYTNPLHIINWNFADPSWHCPKADNNMQVGGIYKARMEARDGSAGFDFECIYSEIIVFKEFTYGLGEKTFNVKFANNNNQTEVIISFDPETENPIEIQKAGWQAILNNFKDYTESN